MLSYPVIPHDRRSDRDPATDRGTNIKAPEIQTVQEVYRAISQRLDDLVHYGAIAGACVVWKNPKQRQRQKAIAQTDNTVVYPLPPLPRIEALLRSQPQGDSQLCLYKLGNQIISDYYLYGYWLDDELNGGSRRSSYFLAWHPVELQPSQSYMIQQQALLLQIALRPILHGPIELAPPPSSSTIRSQEVASSQTLQALRDAEHQLRTPLTLIQLYTNLLQEQLPIGEMRKYADRIQSTVDGIQSSLTHLCQGQLRQRPKRDRFDLRLLLLEVLEASQPLLDSKNINLALDLQSCLAELDEWQIHQVLQNIVDNAIFFSPSGATISCRCIGFQREVLIQIADQGAGLSVQDQQQVFQAHYSRRSGGSGLGLAIAKQIIQHHAGNIWAENLPVGGAQFSISLPR